MGNKNQSTIRMLFLEGIQPVLMAGLHFLAGLNLNSSLRVSDNGVDFLVIVCVPIGDFLTATVIKLADYASYLTESKAADSASVSEGLGAWSCTM